MIIDRCQHHLAEPLSFNQIAEFADRRLVWPRLGLRFKVIFQFGHQHPPRKSLLQIINQAVLGE
jgi:hypothetical protein